MNLASLGEENVARFGEYVALHFEGRDITNVEQQRATARVANALRRLGAWTGRASIGACCGHGWR